MNMPIIGTNGLDPDVARSVAAKKLHDIITNGRANARPRIQQILDTVPQDTLVRAPKLRFKDNGSGVEMVSGSANWGLHPHAIGQLATKANVPAAYLRQLESSREEWQRNLAAEILNEHYGHQDDHRVMVRAVDGVARGVLSDRYRRLDSRPMLGAFVDAADKLGAVLYEGRGSDVRDSVRMIIPTVQEPAPGECMVWGMSWSNSDYGAGAYALSFFALRLVCLNGMVSTNALRKQHVGRALDENIEFSQQTYKLDTDTMVSATKDIVAAHLSPAAIQAENDRIAAAHEEEVQTGAMMRKVSKRLTTGQTKKVKELFEGDDNINLPAGRTAWRFSNALSFLANKEDDFEGSDLLQRLASDVLG